MERRQFLFGSAAAVAGMATQPAATQSPPATGQPIAPTDIPGAVARLRKQFLGQFDPAYVENVIGTARADVLKGNGSANRLYGDAGGDKLYGSGGADKLYGGTGSDYGDGGTGRDSSYSVERRAHSVVRDVLGIT